MEYQVQIIESLQRTATVSATSENEAVRLARRLYEKEEIVLDSNDFVGVDFSLSTDFPSLQTSENFHLHTNEDYSQREPSSSEIRNLGRFPLFYKSPNHDFTLLQGDCTQLLPQFSFSFDMIFADPPYFLSNGGISVQSGKVVCVDKGEWDKGGSPEHIDHFNEEWLRCCRDHLKENGTIWVSGTYHNIFSVANKLTQLGFKILNVITWAKTNPPPNISCRYFTYSTEFVIWARKQQKVPHYYNYALMKQLNGDKQMTDVWRLPAIARWEKSQGKHPTQKPLSLLARIILASTKPGAWVLDPFAGSSTTGIAANLLGRRYLGIEREEEFLRLSRARREEIESLAMAADYRHRIKDIAALEQMGHPMEWLGIEGLASEETTAIDLPF